MAGVDGGNGGALPPATATSMKSSIVPIAILALATATVSSAAFAQPHGTQHRGLHHGQHQFGAGHARTHNAADGSTSTSEIYAHARRYAQPEHPYKTTHYHHQRTNER